MTNAGLIAKIKAEIERLKTVQLKRIQEGDLVDAEPYDKNEAYNELLSFISTLEESERPEPYNPVYDEAYLNEKIKKATESWKGVDVDAMLAECRGYDEEESEKPMNQDEVVINGHKVAYDKDKDAITMEEIQNDPEKAADKYEQEYSDDETLGMAFIAGAKWQKEHDAELIEIAYNDGITIGMTKQKEQMLKEAVEGEYDKYPAAIYLSVPLPRMNNGDKVRIIIVKED